MGQWRTGWGRLRFYCARIFGAMESPKHAGVLILHADACSSMHVPCMHASCMHVSVFSPVTTFLGVVDMELTLCWHSRHPYFAAICYFAAGHARAHSMHERPPRKQSRVVELASLFISTYSSFSTVSYCHVQSLLPDRDWFHFACFPSNG